MNRTAQVNSVDAIDRFRAALGLFGEEVGQALSAIRTDLQRFLNWLEHDQLKHWQHEIRVREERVGEAKGDLHRCLAATIDPNRTPSCLQEKKLLAAAKQRLEEAERKLSAVRHWIVVVRQAVIDYHARAEPLATAVAADVPRSMTELARTVARVNAYLELAPPGADQPSASDAGPSGQVAASAPQQTDGPPCDADARSDTSAEEAQQNAKTIEDPSQPAPQPPPTSPPAP